MHLNTFNKYKVNKLGVTQKWPSYAKLVETLDTGKWSTVRLHRQLSLLQTANENTKQCKPTSDIRTDEKNEDILWM